MVPEKKDLTSELIFFFLLLEQFCHANVPCTPKHLHTDISSDTTQDFHDIWMQVPSVLRSQTQSWERTGDWVPGPKAGLGDGQPVFILYKMKILIGKYLKVSLHALHSFFSLGWQYFWLLGWISSFLALVWLKCPVNIAAYLLILIVAQSCFSQYNDSLD